MALIKVITTLVMLLSATRDIAALPTSGIQTPTQLTPFDLVTQVVSSGNSSYDNLQIIGQHSGAGQNLAVAVPSDTQGLNFTAGGYILKNTQILIQFEAGSNLPPYGLGLMSGGSSIIPSVSSINQGTNLNGIGKQTPGFVIDGSGYVYYGGSDFPNFLTFTVCGGATAYGSQEDVLFWRNATSEPDTVHCADVKLLAHVP